MRLFALAAVCLFALFGVLAWTLRGAPARTSPAAEPVAARAAGGDAPTPGAALEREPATSAPERAVVNSARESAQVTRDVAHAVPPPLPELAGERTWEQLGVGFFGAELVEVAHVFELVNRGTQPITFVSARAVTISTTSSGADWPRVLAPGQSLELEVVNKLRVEQEEKTSRVELLTDTGAIVTLTLRARAAR